MANHQVLVYGDEDSFVASTGPFLAEGVERFEALLAVTTARRIGVLRDYLGDDATQVQFVEADSWYSSPTSALSAYRGFLEDDAARSRPWARILGEPVWAGGAQSEIGVWNRYESLLNMAFSSMPVTVLCPYDERSDPAALAMARTTHPQILEGNEVTDNPSYQDPGAFVLGPDEHK
jgi:hypothetical protein